MELDDELTDMQDPQQGAEFELPNCVKCKFNENGFCKRYDADILNAGVNIFHCPSFVDKEKEDATELFGRKM